MSDSPEVALLMTPLLAHILDLGGTFVFAISGALTAARRRMDLFGVMVLAFCAGNAGGIVRDLLIGAVPPAAISNALYLSASILAGLIVWQWYPQVIKLSYPVKWLDAVGLAFFAVAGAEKALAYGMGPVMSALLGMLTGIGGGMLRDILANEVPAVLRSDLYAMAALTAAAVVVAGHSLNLPPVLAAGGGMTACFIMRYLAIRHNWRLPARD